MINIFKARQDEQCKYEQERTKKIRTLNKEDVYDFTYVTHE